MQPGEIVGGKFTVERLAGSGGMGAVYRATDPSTGEAVAIKVLQGARAHESERFLRESRVLSELAHPNIVRYVGHGATQDGAPYLAMEWLEGEDLQLRLARAPLSLGETITLAAKIAAALTVAHAGGVIHRDIKPSNLFLVNGSVEGLRLLDFGIARVTHATQTMTNTDTTLGTPEYMSPEQARGAPDLDARTDIFSLGCVLYECLTGKPAFSGHHVMALLARVLLEDAPRVRELRPEVPVDLDALVARMLAKDPKERPIDGSALEAEIAGLGTMSPSTMSFVPVSSTLTRAEQRLLSVVIARTAAKESPDVNAATVAAEVLPGLDRYRAVASHFGGTLERLLDGTLIVTLSGTARAATDQALQAARCALAFRELLPEAPMALATGRGDLSARGPVGEVIERAAKLLRRPATMDRLPTEGARHVRVDEVTAGLLDARFDLAGDSKGLVLTGEHPLVESKRTLLGRETPCVGRERELSMVEGVFDEAAREPRAHVVVVTGVAGVGKSRLRQEALLRLAARVDAPQVWIARADPLGNHSPFGLLGQILRRVAGLLDGEPVSVRRQKLRARVSRHVPPDAASRVAEFLGEIAGTPFDEQGVQLSAARRDAMLMGDQMRRAWEDFVRAETSQGPLLIVLEDLHWGDLPTVSFVDAALRALYDRPLMVLALARPEVRESFPRLWSERAVTYLQLDKLTKKASEKLVRELLGDALSPGTVAKLIERSAGNPFYLEEMIRSVAEGRGEDFPETVLAMVQTRLEALDADTRHVLRAASIFGQVFWKGALEALLGSVDRATSLDELLEELVAKEIILRRGKGKFPGEDEFAFRHAQLREGALQMLTDADSVLGHRLAGAWLAAAGESDAMVLAEHFERGGEPASAVAWYRRAAEHALGGNDFEAAVARAEKGIVSGAEASVTGALRLVQAEAHRWSGDSRQAAACASLAMAILEAGTPLWYAAAGETAVASTKLGELDALEDVARRVLARDEDPGMLRCVHALARIGMQLLSAGKRQLAEEIILRIPAASSLTDPIAEAWALRAQALFAHFGGDNDAHLRLMTASAERFSAAGDARNACVQRMNAGAAAMLLGQLAESERALRAALEDASRLGLQTVEAAAKHALGGTLRRGGKTDTALAVEREAVALFQAHGDRRMEAGSRIYLASILLEMGDLVTAEIEASRALEMSSGAIRVSALSALAQVLMALRRFDEALARALEAMALMSSLGGVEEGEASLRLVHAEALAASGDSTGAHAAISQARDRLLRRASEIRDTAHRRTFLDTISENARTLRLAEEWSHAT